MTSCASVGTEMNSSQVQQIKKGQTTRSDLIAQFGPPMNVGIQGGTKTAMWHHNTVKNKAQNFIPIVGAFSGGIDMRQQMLMVTFDEQDRVKDYTFTDSTPEIKTGIF
ncbi:MAG: hypothetical protein KJO21_02035 [Verrucomicrobiae bacterium]|nr:hypothetical protein [Verrucomicrobiae bacterium]NNJ44078.1 hypothetical protein [Akkermansiaceae bacterium]